MQNNYDKSGMNINTYKTLFDDTQKKPKGISENDKILDEIISFSNVNFNEETKQYKYENEDNLIIYYKLSDFIDVQKIERILETSQKSKKCHIASIMISGDLEIENRILTGNYVRHKEEYLHSVIEVKDEEGNLYIMDYTMNIIMPKDSYIKLTEFKEIEAITDLEFLNDIHIMSQISQGLSTKAYLAFRREIMKDLKKNEKIFEDDNER